jgi:hypothetical protein
MLQQMQRKVEDQMTRLQVIFELVLFIVSLKEPCVCKPLIMVLSRCRERCEKLYVQIEIVRIGM